MTMARWSNEVAPSVPYRRHPLVLCHNRIHTEALTLARVGKYVGLIAVDEPMIDGVKDELQAVGDSQLVKYVRQVMFGSVLANLQLPRKILVCIASTNECYNLPLTGGEAEGWAAL